MFLHLILQSYIFLTILGIKIKDFPQRFQNIFRLDFKTVAGLQDILSEQWLVSSWTIYDSERIYA